MGACCYDTPYGYTGAGAYGPYDTTSYEATTAYVPAGAGFGTTAVVDPGFGATYGAYGAAPVYGGATYI